MSAKEDDNVKLCPKCNKPMVLKEGVYGVFWGCSKYPKCNGSVKFEDTCKNKKQLQVIDIDYKGLISDGKIEELVSECADSDPKLYEMFKKNYNIEQCMEDNNFCYEILSHLQKSGRYIDISKIIYSIYLVRGCLTSNFKFWINRNNYSYDYLEKDIKNAIIGHWNESIFSREDLIFKGEEFFVGDKIEGGGKVDILAYKKSTDKHVLIEIKGPRVPGKQAWGQLKKYLFMYELFYKKIPEGLIICNGYPFGIYEDIFRLIGYMIDDQFITFIPWNMY